MALTSNLIPGSATDSATLEKITALREMIQMHRNRAIEGWKRSATKEEINDECRQETLGKFTEQLKDR